MPIGKIGWRRVLIAVNNKNQILGHIDVKSYDQKHTSHRAILGMGVHRDHRRQGVGGSLIESMFSWVKANTELAQIDLWVLSQNLNAIKLYFKSGFKKIAEVEEMYGIDNKSYNAILMTKELE
ncbi:GNAT family N-acetyltransferase [Dokdonia ponticola]|uniref:GNAT family N-acetyltransferase n=1 Tax=Dokdonia ponticola TaxID=2041041 RepID=A0ABV9HZH0_9FLAO